MNCLYCLYYFLKVKVTFTAYTAYTVAHMPTYIANRNIYRLKRYGDMAIWLNGLCSKKGEWVTGLDRTRYPSDFYRVFFLTGPPDFQYQNEKQVAANQD